MLLKLGQEDHPFFVRLYATFQDPTRLCILLSAETMVSSHFCLTKSSVTYPILINEQKVKKAPAEYKFDVPPMTV